jgi:hypothetical protein
MKCLRCGRCCFNYVVVIKPKSIKEDLDLDSLEEKDLLCLDGSSKCPHLNLDEYDASCNIHHYKWFKDTPCGRYTQIESDESCICRTGKYMRENPDVLKKSIGENNGTESI